MSAAARLAALCGFALLGWQWLWQLWLAPPQSLPGWLAASALSLPILPAVLWWLRRHRHAGFWGAVAALLYFAIGVMEAWTDASARLPGLVQACVAATLVVAASWDGMRARFSKRR
ncbi:MAG TPA: DUF2069 domain-containing protein [Arenimonas sp.]|nr:DUF2069 domain-containing protein [Arenimonas sp.]